MESDDRPPLVLRYRPAAVAQLDDIFSGIAANNPVAAHRVINTIHRSITRLAYFPYSSRSSAVPGIRELPIVRYPYIAFYAVDDAAREVHILRVRHTSRDPRGHLD